MSDCFLTDCVRARMSDSMPCVWVKLQRHRDDLHILIRISETTFVLTDSSESCHARPIARSTSTDERNTLDEEMVDVTFAFANLWGNQSMTLSLAGVSPASTTTQ